MKSATKSCSLDPIATDILKKHIKTLVPAITRLKGVVPKSFKRALVKPSIYIEGIRTGSAEETAWLSLVHQAARASPVCISTATQYRNITGESRKRHPNCFR